ncbi:MAG: hypothetical protein IJ433_04295 [Ruminococcus sp.]|nr:hypothetical protein [Ruminococcus sp.]
MRKTGIRIIAILLCAVISMTLTSCTVIDTAVETVSSLINPKGMVEDTSLGYTEMDSTDFAFSPHYTPIKCRQSYNSLENDKMRELYDMLLESSYYVYPKSLTKGEYKCRQVILLDASLTEAQIRLVIKALTDDNPQVFWLTTTFGFLTDIAENYTAVQLYSRSHPEKLKQNIATLKTQVNEFFKSVDSNLCEYEREKTAHNFILNKCEYDESLKDAKTVPLDKASAFDPYGVMVEGVAVCEGYARTFQMLCNGLGLECINVIGESENELHMWNAVELDGDYYYVDTTWDDKDDEAFMYDYFNISEKQLLNDHDFSPLSSEMSDEDICGDGRINALTSNFFIPKCTSTAYNYYIRESVHLTRYESDEITKSLEKAAKNKDKYFHFYIEPKELTYEYAVDQLFFSYPQYFFKYVDEVNYNLPDYSLDKNNLSLYQKETISVVTVMLKYV